MGEARSGAAWPLSPITDSHDWRRFTTFHLKFCLPFTQFTKNMKIEHPIAIEQGLEDAILTIRYDVPKN